MATKFNRNDVNVADDRFYVDDYRTDLNGIEAEIQERITDFEIVPCILEGLEVQTITGDYASVKVTAGAAYDEQGRKISVPQDQIVSLQDMAGGDNFIVLTYAQATDTPRKAFLTGVEYNTRVKDSFQITVTTTQPTSGVILGKVVSDGSSAISVDYSLRTNPVAKPQPTDPNPPSQPTITSVTTGPDVPLEQPKPLARDMRPPLTAYVDVKWTAATDASGIAYYRVLWVPYVSGTPQLAKATEFRTAGTYLRLRGIPIGERGRVWLTAVDRAGNACAWVESSDITAGVGTGLTQPPQLTLTRQKGGVVLTITPDPGEASSIAGYEIFLNYDSPPSITKEYLWYAGPATRHRIPLDAGVVYVIVRAYDHAGDYSPEASASASPITLEAAAGQPVQYIATIPVNHTFSSTGAYEEVGQFWIDPYGRAVQVNGVMIYRTDDLSHSVTVELVGLEATQQFPTGQNKVTTKPVTFYFDPPSGGTGLIKAAGTAGDTFSGYIHIIFEPIQ